MPQIGIRDMHYAILLSDDANGVSYDTVKSIKGAVNATITPTTNSATHYADDGPQEVATALGEITLAIQTSDLPAEVLADLLGHTVDSKGALIKKSTDVAPYVAFGFKSEKSSGGFKYVWLYKGKFRPQEQVYNTKTDTPEFQTPTINASFVRRDYDNNWQVTADEPVFTDGAAWFNTVYEENQDTTPPTVTVSPTDGASSVPVSSNVIWTFSKAIRESDVTGANFFVVDDTGAEVAGTLSISYDKKIVTFDPTSNLASLTNYIAVASKNVRDLAGNPLAQNSITNFTTA